MLIEAQLLLTTTVKTPGKFETQKKRYQEKGGQQQQQYILKTLFNMAHVQGLKSMAPSSKWPC
jgi:hypothetical protein